MKASESLPGILVVDDNPSNLLAVEAALSGLSASIVRAGSGVEALRHLLSRDFALVLLDVQMPSLDGFETARLIRQRERNRETPIIFLTAYSSDDKDVLKAYEMGAVDFLFKPIVPEILHAKALVLLALQHRTKEVELQAARLREQERQLHEQELAEQRRSWEQDALRQQMEEQARVAAEMERRANELRRTVAEREKAQRQLTLMNQQLAESDKRKDEFLAVLAHELRNPLAPIVASVGLLETLLRGKVAADLPQIPAALGAMQRQVQHLTRLVDDLLDISRITSGKIELRSEPLELNALVEQALSTSEAVMRAHDHEVRVDLDPQPIYLVGDAVRLTQVVANLLNNAARYTARGGTICVETRHLETQAIIRVRDNGEGIPEHMLESIFDTFFQSRPNGEGLGLGLTLVRRLVELHDGVVRAKSLGEAQGSEFEVRLPAGIGDELPPELGASPPNSHEAPPSSQEEEGGLKLVVIDDNPDVRETVALLLTSRGYSVKCAHSGEAGVNLIVSSRPDAALVDIGLQDLDGYAVAARVREALGADGPPLIAMTGFGQEKDRRRTKEAGFVAHLVKPATPQALIGALHDASRQARTTDDQMRCDPAAADGGEVDAAS